MPRLSWRFWLFLFAMELAALCTAAALAAGAGLDALQAVTRVRASGFGGREDALDEMTRCCRFRLLDWEAESLTRWAFTSFLFPSTTGPRVDTVNRFFLLTRDIRRADFEANRAEDPAERLQRRSELALLRRERDRIRLPAERAISELVSQALEQEGLAPRPVPGAAILPPVAFTLVRPPSVLVISPRTEIRLERTTLLQPGLTDADALRLERDAESLGWSSLVEPTGGYSTYPTIVSDTSPRDFTFSAVAHEWSHTYFIFKPLGFNYFQSPQMRVINETAADIVGRTIAERILEDHFGVAPAQPPGGAEAGPSPPDPPDRFDFRREMRETRLEVERLLQEARVDEAERYMEARRLMFVREGYNIRRLNQAYFAFHGTYAGSPGSINPIGPQLEALFDKTGSLREFVHALERVGSAQDYQRLLETYRVPATTP